MGRKPAIKRRDHGEETLAEIGRSYNVSRLDDFEALPMNRTEGMTTQRVEDIKIFANQCILMRSTYLHRKTLFEEQELLSRTAPIFFGDFFHMSREYLILQVCKITDPAKSGDKENLTTEFLLTHYDFPMEPQKTRVLKELNEKMQVFRSKLLPARNKLISHSDRTSTLDGHALGGVADNEWDDFLLNLQEFVRIIYQKVVGVSLLINSVNQLSDAHSLLKALKQGASSPRP